MHGGLYFVSVACHQVKVSATGLSLVQRSPTECGVSEWGLWTSRQRTLGPLWLPSHAEENVNVRIRKQRFMYNFHFSVWKIRE